MSEETERHVLEQLRILSGQTGELREALTKESAARIEAERERTKAIRKLARALIAFAAVGVLVALTFGGILLDNQRSLRASEQKWCPVLGALISGPPSNTQRGEWIRDVFSQLFADYGCTPADLSDIPDAPTPSPSPDQT